MYKTGMSKLCQSVFTLLNLPDSSQSIVQLVWESTKLSNATPHVIFGMKHGGIL